MLGLFGANVLLRKSTVLQNKKQSRISQKKAFQARFCALLKEHSPKPTIIHEYDQQYDRHNPPRTHINQRINNCAPKSTPHVDATHKKHHYATETATTQKKKERGGGRTREH